jgi:hypothetical protein
VLGGGVQADECFVQSGQEGENGSLKGKRGNRSTRSFASSKSLSVKTGVENFECFFHFG